MDDGGDAPKHSGYYCTYTSKDKVERFKVKEMKG